MIEKIRRWLRGIKIGYLEDFPWYFQSGELKRYVDLWNDTVWVAMPEGIMKDYSKMTTYGFLYSLGQHAFWIARYPEGRLGIYLRHKENLREAGTWPPIAF